MFRFRSDAMVNPSGQKQLGKERFYFLSYFQFMIYHWKKSGQEPAGRNHGGTCLLARSLLSFLMPRDSAWNQSSKQAIPHIHSLSHVIWAIHQQELSFQMTLGCMGLIAGSKWSLGKPWLATDFPASLSYKWVKHRQASENLPKFNSHFRTLLLG